MRSTAEAFCDALREGLKAQLALGQMKYLKVFARTLFSEALTSSNKADTVLDEGSSREKVATADLVDLEEPELPGDYLRGLGAEFKFPGDPKKYAAFIYRRHH
jgi:hypothetical protein